MRPEEVEGPTDVELSQDARRSRSTPMVNAVLIGFMIGIIIYSVVENSVGLFTLVPLYFVFRFLKSPGDAGS